ncbi:MAG: hypothetical protein IPK17_00095 [Chloroflexi bacterium]|uniref:alpha-L-rhamnosidase C-terminal domain-containing protein n=1 Tax=Candidatus Flexifilum breve TaxID=3140694 RepID=UPI0031353BC8|nr:hypothetical protein [Chloroflexota bacterium]
MGNILQSTFMVSCLVGNTGLLLVSAYPRVSPIEVGYKQIRIAPQPGDLTWARGTVPTPFGKLDVEWRVVDSTYIWSTKPRRDAKLRLYVRLVSSSSASLTLYSGRN